MIEYLIYVLILHIFENKNMNIKKYHKFYMMIQHVDIVYLNYSCKFCILLHLELLSSKFYIYKVNFGILI